MEWLGGCQAEQRKREESERLRQNERQNTAERQKNDLVRRGFAARWQ